MARKTVAIGSNTSHYVWQARTNLIKSVIAEGYDVVVLAPKDEYSQKLEELGAKHYHLPMKMNKNPVYDIFLLFRILVALKKIGPFVFLGYTIKPNVYGTIAANLLRIPTVNNIAGLGTLFEKKGILTRIALTLYRSALHSARLVFFQNPDDRLFFLKNHVITHDRHMLLPGSGVDLKKFKFSPLPNDRKRLRFLLVARLLWAKGIREFVQAAEEIRSQYANIDFCILGGMDNDNPDAISDEDLDQWLTVGHILYLGYSDDVVNEISQSDCIVLPSAYPEGTPRVLLEAAAIGRPIITTDTPGCRTTLDDGRTGFLCRARDSSDLRDQILKVVRMSPEERSAMGEAGRQKMEDEFDEDIVLEEYRDIIRTIDQEQHT